MLEVRGRAVAGRDGDMKEPKREREGGVGAWREGGRFKERGGSSAEPECDRVNSSLPPEPPPVPYHHSYTHHHFYIYSFNTRATHKFNHTITLVFIPSLRIPFSSA